MSALAAVEAGRGSTLEAVATELSTLVAGVQRLERIIERLGSGDVASGTPAAEFRRTGDSWSIAFEGVTCRLVHRKGLAYIARLLDCPGEEVHVLDLTHAGAHHPLRLVAPGDDLIDHGARRAYRARVDELRAEIDQAQRFNDPERSLRARDELAFIVRQLEAAHGLGGRARRAVSPAERARQSVTKAIASARGRIAVECPALDRHLDATLRTGTFCVYRPDSREAPDWRL